MSTYDPRTCGARCDECPLGPNGTFRSGHWQPVAPELHDGATVIAICDSRKTANAVIREHKRTRDTGAEFQNRANWWVRRERVRTANARLTRTERRDGK